MLIGLLGRIVRVLNEYHGTGNKALYEGCEYVISYDGDELRIELEKATSIDQNSVLKFLSFANLNIIVVWIQR